MLDQLCEFILKHSKRKSLLKVTLQTLQRFLTWIPLGFIFQTDLIHMLLDSFFSQPAFRNDALECLAEIGTLADLEPQYDTLFQSLYLKFMARLGEIFTPETNLAAAYENGSEDDCVFIQRLALFFCGFFRAHLKVLETPQHSNQLLQGLFYLVRISEVPDNEVFKICLEYWHMLTADLYESEVKLQVSVGQSDGGTSLLSTSGEQAPSPPL